MNSSALAGRITGRGSVACGARHTVRVRERASKESAGSTMQAHQAWPNIPEMTLFIRLCDELVERIYDKCVLQEESFGAFFRCRASGDVDIKGSY